MTDSVSVSLLPQFVETTDTVFNGRRLHAIQKAFLQYDLLPEFAIITAPTGTGKSFAFPLPIIAHKQNNSFSKRRCVIVSPTNALIEDMEREYKEKFADLKVTKLNRDKLDELNAKGPARWDALFQVITNNEIIITNPDLLNFALFGGYVRHKGQHEITQLFARVDYFVFDEYHLYDEEQIANIVSWIVFSKATVQGKACKFIFASATAEKGLVDVLKEQGFDPVEIIEEITDQQTATTRLIHGKIDVTFTKGLSLRDYILDNSDLIHQWIKAGEKILIIFDRLIDLRIARPLIEREFDDVAIAEESGYLTKSKIKEDTTNAKLILATNKVEVGVNLNVSICLMQTGRHFANFVQRFGRVARQGNDGKVVIFLENKIKEIERNFAEVKAISYYDFVKRCRNIELLSDRKFYSDKVPQYLGAYFYIISRNIKNYTTRTLFNSKMKLDGQSKFMHGLFYGIDKGIFRLKKINRGCGKGYDSDMKHWDTWWKVFTDTFKYFRASKPDALVKDFDFKDGQLIRYSLEWILRNREIIGTEEINGEPCLLVSGFSDSKNDLQYYIESMPIHKLSEGTLYLHQSERFNLKQEFKKRVNQIADERYRNGDAFRKTARQLLLDEISKLALIFTEKRLAITEVRSFSNII